MSFTRLSLRAVVVFIAVSVMLFSLIHNPCSTTIYTIYKETGDRKWTVVSALLPLFPAEGGVQKHIQQLNWTQLAVAGSVFLLELGFLLMYRYGWNLSTANVITGVFINVALVGIGITVLGEKISPLNAVGIVLSIVGVAMISYRS